MVKFPREQPALEKMPPKLGVLFLSSPGPAAFTLEMSFQVKRLREMDASPSPHFEMHKSY